MELRVEDLELLSRITKNNITKVKSLRDIHILHTEFNGYIVEHKNSCEDYLIDSIETLITKCELWALNKGYILLSGTVIDMKGSCVVYLTHENDFCEECGEETPLVYFLRDTKIEAVLECCRFIENKKDK